MELEDGQEAKDYDLYSFGYWINVSLVHQDTGVF
jgi:hypothetical protein